MTMIIDDQKLLEAQSEDTLRRMLQRRGVLVGADVPKSGLIQQFGLGLSFSEWKELHQTKTDDD